MTTIKQTKHPTAHVILDKEFGMKPGKDPTFFGPPKWMMLQCLPFICLAYFGGHVGRSAWGLYYSLSNIMECAKCRKHFKAYLKKHPMNKRTVPNVKAWIKYNNDFHNAVNRRHNKQRKEHAAEPARDKRGIVDYKKPIMSLQSHTSIYSCIWQQNWEDATIQSLFFLLHHFPCVNQTVSRRETQRCLRRQRYMRRFIRCIVQLLPPNADTTGRLKSVFLPPALDNNKNRIALSTSKLDKAMAAMPVWSNSHTLVEALGEIEETRKSSTRHVELCDREKCLARAILD